MNKLNNKQYETYTDLDFDRYLNIETIPYIETFTNHHSNRYEPTPYQDVLQLLSVTQQDYHDYSLLVDFGSGLMRIPIFMHNMLGIDTIGIELNKQSYLHGLNNLKQYELLNGKSNIQSFNLNATEYKFKGAETHLFFFNPFSVFIFQKVMAHLIDSSVTQCDIILYYAKPEYEMYLSDLPQFKLKYTIPLTHYKDDPSEKINIYTFTQIHKD
ncbi:hypothetical protein ROU88_04885 [Macrococcus capreoli]|uniref:hypothetical protein n=1 Tax=Macrococcus capreoli TaxID=2982690 RepID=UPI0021D5A653|nr:hypothetical protein [Macrococcus sp. TMW 2.2395]MCU7556797.1 hypothetical protein [Macrococcus sp. TMW 2.2395]